MRLHYEWLSLKLELVELPTCKVSEALFLQTQMFYIRKENQRCWDKLKCFEKTGKILLDKVLLPLNNMTDLQKLKKFNNLRSSYSKRKNTLEKWMEVGADHTKIMKKKNDMKVIDILVLWMVCQT